MYICSCWPSPHWSLLHFTGLCIQRIWWLVQSPWCQPSFCLESHRVVNQESLASSVGTPFWFLPLCLVLQCLLFMHWGPCLFFFGEWVCLWQVGESILLRLLRNINTVKSHFMDICLKDTSLLWTFFLSLGKKSPCVFSKFNLLNTDTMLIRTLCMTPSSSLILLNDASHSGIKFQGPAITWSAVCNHSLKLLMLWMSTDKFTSKYQ